MDLFEQEDFDLGDIENDDEYGSADDQHAEAHAFRFVQIIPKECIRLVRFAFGEGVDHPVVFLCDVSDPMGLAIARKFVSQDLVDQSIRETKSLESKNPGVGFWRDLDTLKGSEPTIHDAVRGRMAGFIGYFPIVVAARGGFSIFPWPMEWLVESKGTLNLVTAVKASISLRLVDDPRKIE